MLNSSIVSSIQSSVCGLSRFGGPRLPSGYIARWNAAGVDIKGLSLATVQPKYHLLGDGSGYLAGTVAADVTIVSKQGTASVTIPSANRISVGVGTLWSLLLSNGSRYEFPQMVGASAGVMFDVSGNGRHLTLTSYTLATAIVSSLTTGSNWLNVMGWSKRQNWLKQSHTLTVSPWAGVGGATVAAGNVVSYPASGSAYFEQNFNVPVSIGDLLRFVVQLRDLTSADKTLRLYATQTSAPYTETKQNTIVTDDDTETAVMEIVSTINGNMKFAIMNAFTALAGQATILCTQLERNPTVGGLLTFGDSICAAAMEGPDGIRSISRAYTGIYGRNNGAIYRNYGSPGNTLTQIEASFDGNAVIAGSVGLQGGVNDCYQADTDPNAAMRVIAERLIGKALAKTGNVWFVSINYSDIGATKDLWCLSFNTWLQAKCAELDVVYVDSRAICSTDGSQNLTLFNADRTHLNRAGHQAIADWLIANIPYTGALFDPAVTTTSIITGLQPALADLSDDATGNNLQFSGRYKKSLLEVSPGVFAWPVDPELIDIVGLDNAIYTAGGEAVTFESSALALAALVSLEDATRLVGGVGGRRDGAAMWGRELTTKEADKANRYFGNTINPDEGSLEEDGTLWLTEDGTPITQEDGTP